MPPTRKSQKGWVVAREASVQIVGATPPVYEQVTVIHNKTGEPVKINKDQPSDPGSEGMPYAFRQYQKVHRSHPAVQANPGAFMDIEDLEDSERELVTT